MVISQICQLTLLSAAFCLLSLNVLSDPNIIRTLKIKIKMLETYSRSAEPVGRETERTFQVENHMAEPF